MDAGDLELGTGGDVAAEEEGGDDSSALQGRALRSKRPPPWYDACGVYSIELLGYEKRVDEGIVRPFLCPAFAPPPMSSSVS